MRESPEHFWGTQGAGVLVYCPSTRRFLLGYRSAYVNEPHTWGLFGGAIDANEDPKEAAMRELEEEIKFQGRIKLLNLDVFQKQNFKFHNFLGIVQHEFDAVLDWENEDAQWFELNEFPEPLHFGLARLVPLLKNKIK